MNLVQFPILNFKININPIAFTIFGIDIYWYAILITTAIAIGIIIFKIKDRTF